MKKLNAQTVKIVKSLNNAANNGALVIDTKPKRLKDNFGSAF